MSGPFSWYTYAPTRIRYPYVRGPLLELWRRAKEHAADPVEAWEWLTADPERCGAYKRARGKGGFVRCEWPEVAELVAAAYVHTAKRYGQDRIVGFSPIPAMSMTSYAIGTRFLSVKNHISRLLAKLGVERRIQAAVIVTEAQRAQRAQGREGPQGREGRDGSADCRRIG